MRLIDADALIEKWYEVNNIGPEDRGARFIGYTEIPRFINNAPTVQPTGDLISRADAIEAVEEEDCLGYIECKAEKIYDRINALPSAEADWIPVSERLPSEDGDYLVCKSWEYHGMDVLQWVDGWNCYRGYDGKINRESEIDGANILAWMPLPKPYKGGDTE